MAVFNIGIEDQFRGLLYRGERWNVSVSVVERLVSTYDVMLGLRLDLKPELHDGRRSIYYVKIEAGIPALYYNRANLDFSREVFRSACERAIAQVESNPDCCVKHVLAGRYDGTPCVGTRKDGRLTTLTDPLQFAVLEGS